MIICEDTMYVRCESSIVVKESQDCVSSYLGLLLTSCMTLGTCLNPSVLLSSSVNVDNGCTLSEWV